MGLSLGRAAKAVGRSKSALSRDVKSGKISATRNPDGSLSIEPSELFRVFPASQETGSGNPARHESQPLGNGAATAESVPDNTVQQATDSLQLHRRLPATSPEIEASRTDAPKAQPC
jgi:hypothetical protein